MKPRSQRLLPAVDQAHRNSETALRQFGEQQDRLATAERQLAELRRYREEYALGRHAGGMSVHALLNRQQFVDRIDGAISQQLGEVARRQRLLDQAGQAWREAHARERALGSVIERASELERASEERHEQNAIDERMQHRMPSARRHSS
jgi:flagellar FliJ protein